MDLSLITVLGIFVCKCCLALQLLVAVQWGPWVGAHGCSPCALPQGHIPTPRARTWQGHGAQPVSSSGFPFPLGATGVEAINACGNCSLARKKAIIKRRGFWLKEVFTPSPVSVLSFMEKQLGQDHEFGHPQFDWCAPIFNWCYTGAPSLRQGWKCLTFSFPSPSQHLSFCFPVPCDASVSLPGQSA